MKKSFILFFLTIYSISFAQQQDSLFLKNGIEKPSLLPLHHFGIFSARINQNFKITPPKKSTLNFSLASANTFHPFVEMYLPKDEMTQNEMRELIWYNRHFYKNQQETPADYENIIIDAVFKEFRIDYTTQISENQELGISLRSYLVTKGKYPFSIITGDEFIEWFHSNIAGGEDPFGRKYYGLNQVNVKYTDRNGRSFELEQNDVFLGGIEFNHFYYPKIGFLNQKKIYINFGSHLGLNTSSVNSSIDLGFSANILKDWKVSPNKNLKAALGSAILRRNLVNLKSDNVQLGNNQFLKSFEAMIEYAKKTKKGNYHSIGVNYQIQSSFSKADEANYYQLVGKWEEIHSGWQNGFEKLYEWQSAWSWLYSYRTKKYVFGVYIKQDLYLNNSPDIQSGISLQIPILN